MADTHNRPPRSTYITIKKKKNDSKIGTSKTKKKMMRIKSQAIVLTCRHIKRLNKILF